MVVEIFATIHLIPLATDYGIPPMTAGNMLAWYGLMSLAGVLIAGPTADLMGSKVPIILTFILRVLLFVMLIQYKNEVSFYVFAFAFGFTHLITAPLTAILIGKLYGLLIWAFSRASSIRRISSAEASGLIWQGLFLTKQELSTGIYPVCRYGICGGFVNAVR